MLHLINKHKEKVHKHIKKHHKKYIKWAFWSFLVSHLVFWKIFAIKTVLFKLSIITLTTLWIFETNQFLTMAELEPICINSVNVIEWKSCSKNYNSLQEWIIALETKTNLDKANIARYEYHWEFIDILEQHCDKKLMIEWEKQIWIFEKDFEKKSLNMTEINILSYLENNYNQIQRFQWKADKKNLQNYCKQKYLLHGLQQYYQSEYKSLLESKWLIWEKLSWNELNDEKNDILVPLIDKQIHTLKNVHNSANMIDDIDIKTIAYKDEANEYTKVLKEKIIELTNTVINTTLLDMNKNKIFSEIQINEIKKKLKVKYMRWCTKTRWLYTIERSFDWDGRILDANLEEIEININFCPSYQYVWNLKEYVEQIFVHELWHHVYYFRDIYPQDFESICRETKNKNKCRAVDFVSKYSQTSSEEDYAESFMHRYTDKAHNTKSNPMIKKFKHFDDMFKIK